MKILYTTDFHFTLRQPKNRTDSYINSMLNKLKEILDYFLDGDIDYWLDGGDFFDTSIQNCELVNSIAQVLRPLRKANSRIICIPGNHLIKGNYEISIKKSGLTTLANMCLVKIEEDPYIMELDVSGKKIKIAMVHETIVEKSVPWEHTLFEDFRKKYGNVDIALLSHVHYPQGHKIVDNIHFISPGSVARGMGNEKDLSRIPQFAVIDLVKRPFGVEFVNLKCENEPFKENAVKEDIDTRTSRLVEKIREILEDYEITSLEFPLIVRKLVEDGIIQEDCFDLLIKKYEEFREK